MSREFLQFTDECGIVRQHTVRNRPQQNGVAEHANRVMSEGIMAMLEESGLSASFWGECLAALIHVWNRCPTSAVSKKTPYELWHGKKPSVSHLRVWGCTAYVHIQKDKRRALGSHMEKCIFIGYPDGYKGWKFYNPATKNTVISERAEFDERYMMGSNRSISAHQHNITGKDKEDNHGEHYYIPAPAIPVEADDDDDYVPSMPQRDEPVEEDEGEQEEPVEEQQPAEDEQRQPQTPPPERPPTPLALRHSKQNVRPPGEWWKVKQSSQEPESDEDDEFEDAEHVHSSSFESEPTSYREAMAHPDAHKWHEAALEELNAHLGNGTWTLEKLPPGKKAIGSKWVFKIKRKADGTIERYKARIVAKGYNQRPGFDYVEIFAPTMRQATIRLVLALAAIEDMHLRSVDISHAFINGDIDAEVYMMQPEGFQDLGSDYVCRLDKSIYGLKQAARLWNEKLHHALLQMGFDRIKLLET